MPLPAPPSLIRYRPAQSNALHPQSKPRDTVSAPAESPVMVISKPILDFPPGSEFSVRVTPKAARNAVVAQGDTIRVYVTSAPEDGKATKAVINLLAKSLGIAKSRLVLIRGATSRDKQFRVM